MKKRKIIITIIVIILLLITLFLANTYRKFIIIKELQKNIEQYKEKTNYHIKSNITTDDSHVTVIDYYLKDNKEAMIMENNSDGEKNTMSMYYNGERTDVFYDDKEGKTVDLNVEHMQMANIYNTLETENDFETLRGCISCKIRKENFNNKECYVINDFYSSAALMGTEKNEVYIEKDTGLFYKTDTDGMITVREYEFGNVDDDVFIEPNVEEYKILD